MTRDEAIKALTQKTNPMMQYEALGVAIRSLEAWDEIYSTVKNEVEENGRSEWRDVLYLIWKHMREVETDGHS